WPNGHCHQWGFLERFLRLHGLEARSPRWGGCLDTGEEDMLEEEENRKVNRRRLLRRAGTVVAGVAGAGVAPAVGADPAQAANGANVLIGNSNGDPGDNTTSLSHTNASTPTLNLVNGNTDGPALALSPVDTLNNDGTPNASPTSNGPVGSLIADDYGD